MEKTKRLLTLLLAGIMILASAVPVFAEEAGDGLTAEDPSKSILNSLSNISYADYLNKHKDVPGGKGEVVINGLDYDKEATTATVSSESGVYGEEESVLRVGVDGDITWVFDVPAEGMYNITFNYAAVAKEDDGVITSGAQNIERVFYINNSVPFAETRTLSLKKTWTYVYTENEDSGRMFEMDSNGNELRPSTTFVGQWETMTLTDTSTFYVDPFAYYFNEGTNSITLEAIREEMYIRDIVISYSNNELPKYEDVLAEYAKKGYTAADAEPIKLDAEAPSFVSDSTITPYVDRSSAISDPQDPTAQKRNSIGGTSWSNPSTWVSYTFNVEKSGLYQIVTRYKQDTIPGSFVSRAVKVDGAYPFEEARFCTFEYGQDWRVAPLHSGDTEFLFYLEAGEHTVQFMTTVGFFGEVLTRVTAITEKMNDAYLQITKLTGPYPDEYRDYNFSGVMPEAIEALGECADDIDAIIEYIKELLGGEAYNIASIKSAAKTLREMTKTERSIATNLSLMKSDISTLGTWCNDLKSQPLLIDHIHVQNEDAPLPAAGASMWQSLKYEIAQFIGSFYTDYNSFDDGGNEEGVIGENGSLEIWTSAGRDRTTIIRDLINSGFCETEKIAVSLKLVDMSALLPSILAGIGPDISLEGVSLIDYAIRGAVLPLNDMPGFDEICERFYPSTLIPLTLYGNTYAIPTSVSFPMMFTRNDVLGEVGLGIPKTWDEFLATIPVLQYNNMMVIIPNNYHLFLYQMEGGSIWDETSDDPMEWGWRVNYDNNTTLEAFSKMCEVFTQYSLEPAPDFQTRFKTGVAPIAITDYSAYTTLTVFAPEIAGLWSMNPIPGTVQADGSINNTAVAGSGGVSMLKGCSDEAATWRFICWMTDAEFQVDLCNELISLLGPAAKTTSANIEAMAEMPWSAEEYRNLMAQYKNTTAITAYPASYVVDRYTGMAFNAAYSNGENPAEALLSYVNIANEEISRKRKEFDYPIYEESEQAKADAAAKENGKK